MRPIQHILKSLEVSCLNFRLTQGTLWTLHWQDHMPYRTHPAIQLHKRAELNSVVCPCHGYGYMNIGGIVTGHPRVALSDPDPPNPDPISRVRVFSGLG